MKVEERFLKYVAFHTKSDEKSGTHPSSERQLALAAYLSEELKGLGIENVTATKKGYVYAKIPATAGLEDKPKLGFIAHLDTSPDFPGENVEVTTVRSYDGFAVSLGDSGLSLTPEAFPHLSGWKGRTLFVTNGKTLLGADDKAGIAEIVTMAERLLTEKIPHGPIRIAFTPDEEIGEGADFFDLSLFDADFAYTADGDLEGGIEYENFNAASAVFTVKGVNVHPGSAKDIMKNAILIASEIISSLPESETPAKTHAKEGFYHVTDISGTVDKAEISLIVRDHDAAIFDARLAFLSDLREKMNAVYGPGTVSLSVREQYRNMREKIEPHRHLIDNAKEAARRCGVTPYEKPVRGGTDGARLSFMGLPCPNLGTGGFAFHGPYEHISLEGMEKSTDILLTLVQLYAK